MFRTNVRRLVLALSLLIATASLLPAGHTAAAAPIAGGSPDTADIVQWVELPGLDDVINAKMSFHKMGVSKSGRNTLYQFKLQADEGTLMNVQVTTFSYYKSIANDAFIGQSEPRYPFLGTFWAPDYRHVWVQCNPPAGAYCSAAFVKARTQNGIEVVAANDTDGNKQ